MKERGKLSCGELIRGEGGVKPQGFIKSKR